MRILQVIHQFPPYSSQGSEVYCYNLSKQLRETEDVRVFHISNDRRRWHHRLTRESYLGLPTYHCVDGAEYSRLATWRNKFLRRSFQSVLDEFAPQIVHFHNFLSLGDDLVSIARANGAAVVYTLHDYGLICPNTILLRTDGKLCTKQTADFFQDCCPVLIRTGNKEQRSWSAPLPSLARWRLYGKQYPHPVGRTILLHAVGIAERLFGDPSLTDTEHKRDFFFTHTRRMFQEVDLFIAPSQFLLQRYVSCGLPENKIVHLRYGMRLIRANTRKEPTHHIRFGYIGALHPHKGIELLLEAFQGVGGGASLHIHGSVFNSPVSQNYWRRIRDRQDSGIVLHGAYDNNKITEIFETLDIIVVPSIWYENSPLTIQEAFMAGVPVITADNGGMAELVRHDIDGLHFRLGDAADLRNKMLQVVNEPGIIERLRKGIRGAVDIEQHAAELRDRYKKMVGQATAEQAG